MADTLSPTAKRSRRRIPLRLRLQILLAKWLCGGERSGSVYVLPRNRVTKLDAYTHELDAMEFVRNNTSIRVPKVYKAYDVHDGRQHLVMERLPGRPAYHVLKDWTPQQTDTFSRDLAGIITQLRDLKPPASFSSSSSSSSSSSGKLIGSSSGGANRDGRLSCHPFGPFASVTAFHTYLRFGRPLEHWQDKDNAAVVKVHGRPEDYYAIKFTHADLVPKNILVDDDAHIVGVIDWEFAGWYPEYWEYTKAYYTEMRPQYDNFYRAFETQPGIHKYLDELACEQVIWMRMFSPFAYCDPPWQPGDDDKPKEAKVDDAVQEATTDAPASAVSKPSAAIHT